MWQHSSDGSGVKRGTRKKMEVFSAATPTPESTPPAQRLGISASRQFHTGWSSMNRYKHKKYTTFTKITTCTKYELWI